MMKYLLLIFSFTLLACGPTAKIAPEYELNKPSLVAFLPIETEVGSREERAKYLYRAVSEELRSKGYHVLESSIVERVCNARCDNRVELAVNYPVNAFISLSLDSASKTNFVLGYYNVVSGELLVESLKGKELARIPHSESERGGVVFQSGQLVQGIIDQVENYGDDSFNKLADDFARNLIAQLPKHQSSIEENEALDVAVRDVKVVTSKDDIFKVCAEATPGAQTNIVIDRVRTSLREVSDGKFCGRFRFIKTGSEKKEVFIEARSAFGGSDRKAVSVRFHEL